MEMEEVGVWKRKSLRHKPSRVGEKIDVILVKEEMGGIKGWG